MKFNITTRLYIGFAAAFIVSAAIGIMSYLTYRNQADESKWVRHTYQVVNGTQKILNLMLDMETGRRAYRGTGEPRFLEPYEVALPKIGPAINDLKNLVADNPEEIARVDRLEKEIDKLLAYWKGIGYVSKYDRANVIGITDTEKKQMDIIRVVYADILRAEDKLLAMREADNARSIHVASWSSAIGTILIQAIIFGLIYLIVAEFKNRRRAEYALQENLSTLEALNTESTEKNWLLTGLSNINSSMQGINNISTLAELVLNSITSYMGLPGGAFFVYNEGSEMLQLQASVALSGSTVKSFRLGEGLVGACGKSRDISVIKEIPAGYWSLASGSGQAQPGQIMCTPLWYNDELKGVIELVSFRPVEALEVSLLKTVANNIAVSINAADAREKVMILLEQVQKQKEVLQQQEEELRQSNEELTQQAEILQASEEELKVQEEELRQINAELEEKNEAVEIARQSLSAKARELEITGKYKSEFLANMSHELRTPLNSVMILSKLLSENKSKNLSEKQTEYANIIHKSGNDLLNLINDILDLTKIEAGKMDLNFEPVNIQEISHDLHQLFYVLAEEKSIGFSLETKNTVPEKIVTDKLRLEQIIKNLLSNSFKFTSKGGKVSVLFDLVNAPVSLNSQQLRNADKVLSIAVSDSGIGIAPEKQQVIFEAFQQADGSTNRKYGGTGLGLSISKELVKKLGGEIRLESEEGKGSTFTVYIPLVGKPTDNPATENETRTEDEIPALSERILEQIKLPDDRNNLHKGDKVMLIIEDDVRFAGILQHFARENNYKTIVALQGDEGLLYAVKYRPSAIILDIQLPVIDGRTVLKSLKASDKLKNIPVHVISANDESTSSAPGAIAYLKKPLEKETLENAFSLIGNFLKDGVKKVLVLSGDYLKDNSLKRIISERHFDMECDYCFTEKEAIEKLEEKRYDGLIADIGKDLKKGISELQHIKSYIEKKDIPVIIYMDKDLSTADELELKKVTDIIIRDSGLAKDRLMDELELFLYKVQHAEKVSLPRSYATIADDKILHGRKVLLADDDVRNVFSLNSMLEEQQMEVFTASDGQEALDQINEHPEIDMVLMDIMMPEMDGYEAIKKIRADQRFSKLPIIALTAKAMQGDKEKAVEAGASDYITKPIDNNKLLSLMRVWLS